ncbi:MAG: heme NO-binding domain-containing protein [Pseudomonadales bacterium]|nr:heme NO-binding domain-containing protein [Pseudomonadales bacterium]
MHGVIVSNFKRYLDEFIGTDAWGEVIAGAGLEGKTYLPVALYPDEEMEALLKAAEGATGLRRDDLLADFGEWVMGPLIDMYQAMIPPGWDAMTFLVNMQQIHERILRLKDPAARAPNILVHKRGEDTLEIHYYSHRNMAAMILGAVKGVAAYFNETASLLGSEAGEGGEQRFVFHLEANPAQACEVG